jgi:FkbM family methyltransferase
MTTVPPRLRSLVPISSVLTTAGSAAVRLGAPVGPFERHLPRTARVTASLPDGRRLRLLGGDRLATRIYWHGWDGHEPEASAPWFAIARDARVVVDVGAFTGYYSLLAAFANAEAQVVAFEPLAVLRDRLVRNLTLNHVSRVRVEASALGRRDEVATFWHAARGLPSSSGLDRSFVLGKRTDVVAEEVEVRTLDRVVETLGLTRVDLVKIDTETTEHDVLAGATEVLRRFHPVIFCEVLPKGHGDEIDELVRAHGYRTWLLSTDGAEERPRVEADPVWRNWLFAVEPPAALAATGPGARRG